MTIVLLARFYLLRTLDIMRTYFIRVPQWARIIYPNAVWKASADKVHWTFDDGPHPNSTPQLLASLEELGIRATFFMTASRCLEYPKLVEQVRNAGHEIGSHGYDHLDGWKTESNKYIEDVQKSFEIIDTKLFRPPYGRMTIKQYKVISEICDIIMWSVMPGDFESAPSEDQLARRLEKIRVGDIVVLHDTPFAVKRILPILKRRSIVR